MLLTILLSTAFAKAESTKYGADGITRITMSEKWKMGGSVGANVKVAANGGMSLFYNEKNQTESMGITKDVSSGLEFATSVTEDPNMEKLHTKEDIFARDFNMTPVVISTTKAQYNAAAKKALENYADMFVAKMKYSRKAWKNYIFLS
jgi:trehalose-6-phosphate synthase